MNKNMFIKPNKKFISFFSNIFIVNKTALFVKYGENKEPSRLILKTITYKDEQDLIELFETISKSFWVTKMDTSFYIRQGIDKAINEFKNNNYETSLYYIISRATRMGQYIKFLTLLKTQDKKINLQKELLELKGNYFHNVGLFYVNRLNHFYNDDIFKEIENLLVENNWITKPNREDKPKTVRNGLFHSYLEPKYINKARAVRTMIAVVLLFSVEVEESYLSKIDL